MPMEMQVFFRDQYYNLVVIVALFSNSSASNFLYEIGFGNPQLRDAEAGSIFNIKDTVDLSSFLGYPEKYLYYDGSTTVSPCEGNVTWIILESTYKSSQEQLSNFPSSLYGMVRNTQPLNGRQIYCNFDDVAKGEGEEPSVDDDTLIDNISSGESFKDVNDDFILQAENESYLNDFPEVESIYTGN